MPYGSDAAKQSCPDSVSGWTVLLAQHSVTEQEEESRNKKKSRSRERQRHSKNFVRPKKASQWPKSAVSQHSGISAPQTQSLCL